MLKDVEVSLKTPQRVKMVQLCFSVCCIRLCIQTQKKKKNVKNIKVKQVRVLTT